MDDFSATVEVARPHPVAHGALATWELLRGVGMLLGAVGWRALLVQVAIAAPAAASILVGGWVQLAVLVLSLPLWPLADAITTRLALEEAGHRGSARLGSAIPGGVRRWGPLLGAYVLSGSVIAFLSLFCLVPGVVRALSYLLVGPIVVSGEASARRSLTVSRWRMHGVRGRVFVGAFLVIAPVFAVHVVGNIGNNLLRWDLLPELFGTAGPLELRSVRAATLLAGRVLLVPVTMLPVVVWSKLRHRG